MENKIELNNNQLIITVAEKDLFDFDNNSDIVIDNPARGDYGLLGKSYKYDSTVEVVKQKTIATKGFKTVDWNWIYCEKLRKSVMVECAKRKVKAIIMKDVSMTSKDLGLECKILDYKRSEGSLIISLQITK